jgi:UDP-GlcNAc:undecaprenyl-phosphate/decaprenyl-phosphate GlcNAc-1-phosphate transferase
MPSTFAVNAAIAGVAGLLASLALTPAVRALARRADVVAKPKSDRWHTRPTAMLGGVAIAVAVVGTVLFLVPRSRESLIVLAASSALFLVGLTDDFLHIRPYQKLIGQLAAAGAVVALGMVLPWTESHAVNAGITLFWLVGITNAVNMLDNMDGLAGGVCAIAAAFLAMNFYAGEQWPRSLMLIAFAGALAGFLVYNHFPASIFMGDCGSMFVGFFLASSVLAAGPGGGRSRSVAAVLAVPVLVLVVPIFDTTLVTLLRKLAGRPASQGGRDHTSHRLVALGLSERNAVWMLYGFAVAGGALSMLVSHAPLAISVAVIAAFTILLTILGAYLSRVRVYDVDDAALGASVNGTSTARK